MATVDGNLMFELIDLVRDNSMEEGARRWEQLRVISAVGGLNELLGRTSVV